MTDAELLAAAIDVATQGNRSAFGRLLGHQDGAQVRDWLAGTVRLSSAVRTLLRVIVAHPQTMRRWLADVT